MLRGAKGAERANDVTDGQYSIKNLSIHIHNALNKGGTFKHTL